MEIQDGFSVYLPLATAHSSHTFVLLVPRAGLVHGQLHQQQDSA